MRRAGLVLTVAAIAAVTTLAACDFVNDPSPLQDFTWLAIDDSSAVQEGIDAAGFNGDIDLIGQMRTPTLCYGLSADFNRSGSNLSVRVNAQPKSGDCAQTPGGLQYSAAIRGVGPGLYTLRVTHAIAAVGETTYTKTIDMQ